MVAKKQKASISQIEKNKLKARMRRLELCMTTVIFVKSLYMVISFSNIQSLNKQAMLECNRKKNYIIINIYIIVVNSLTYFIFLCD